MQPAKTSIPRITSGPEAVAAFEGRIKRVWTSPFYLVGLLIVAAAMILLPLLYVALTGLAGYGLYYHATEHVGMLERGGHRFRLRIVVGFLYIAPLIAGVILLFFMIKPLFARTARRDKRVSLVPENEPHLFAFIEHLCEVVGSPKPRRIDVDCDINASAHFRRGLLSLLWPGDLVLTIGVPLAAGLSLRQFTGVLAHEFGHFAQGLGMRLTYIIRSVNGWFARVVYERDSWDDWLTDASREEDSRLAVVFLIARLFLWITRGVLWLLMMIGHVISCAMLRQMEYDADRHATRVVGSAAAVSIIHRLHELVLASRVAGAELARTWRDGKLADDYPSLLVGKAEELPDQAREELHGALETAKAGLLDTHPSDAARMRRARKEAEQGVFRADGSAAILFADFAGLSRSISMVHYRDMIGPQVTPKHLISTAAMARRRDAARQGGAAAERFFHGCLTPLRPLQVDQFSEAFRMPPEERLARLKRARSALEQAIPAVRKAYGDFAKAQETLTGAHVVQALARMGIKFRPTDLGLTAIVPEDVPQEAGEARRLSERAAGQLARIEPVMRTRLECSIALLPVPQVAARLKHADRLRLRAGKLMDALASVQGLSGSLAALRKDTALLRVLADIISSESEIEEDMERRILGVMRTQQEQLSRIRGNLLDRPYPFEHTDGQITLAAHAIARLPSPDDLGGTIQASTGLIEDLDALYMRIMGELARIAEHVEQATS